MGKIIFYKNGKRIQISEFMFKLFTGMKDLYHYDCFSESHRITLTLPKEVTDVIFQEIRFPDCVSIKSDCSQNLLFQNCVFKDKLTIDHANDVILNSSFFHTRISIWSNSCSINTGIVDSIGELNINSSNIYLYNKEKKQDSVLLGDYRLYGNFISFQNVNIKSKWWSKVFTNQFKIENSVLESRDALTFVSQYYSVDPDTIFASNYSISFYRAGDDLIAYYSSNDHQQVVVLGEELLDEKNQAIYSMLSVLKGISNKMNAINRQEKKEFNQQLDSKVQDKKEKITEEIEKLQKKQADLVLSVTTEKEKHRETINKRLIKEIPYKE